MNWTPHRIRFEYDLWANKLWFDYLGGHAMSDEQKSIFQHILMSQTIWFLRLHGTNPTDFPRPEPTWETALELHAKWMGELQGEDRRFDYNTLAGEPKSQWLSNIAIHVVNHGTYHRGDYRGLCRANGIEDFPDTDFVIFALERNLPSLG